MTSAATISIEGGSGAGSGAARARPAVAPYGLGRAASSGMQGPGKPVTADRSPLLGGTSQFDTAGSVEDARQFSAVDVDLDDESKLRSPRHSTSHTTKEVGGG